MDLGENGRIPIDYKASLKYWRSAEKAGEKEARSLLFSSWNSIHVCRYYLGEVYYHGRGVKRDVKKAMVYWKKSKKTQASLKLAEVYELGIDVPANPKRAFGIFLLKTLKF